jgi:large subunit ribosomal protein L29
MASQAAALRTMNGPELIELLSKKRQELMNLRFQLATRKLQDHNKLGEVRREVARILTVMREAGRTA